MIFFCGLTRANERSKSRLERGKIPSVAKATLILFGLRRD